MKQTKDKKKCCKLCRKPLGIEFDWLAKPFYAKYKIICPACTEQLEAIKEIKPATRPKRCLNCGKPVRLQNRSFLCSNCQARLAYSNKSQRRLKNDRTNKHAKLA